MAFPQTVLPVRVRIAPGANPNSAPQTWPAWVDITADVRTEAGIRISDGRANEAAGIDSASASMELDNRVGKYVPLNPASPYFGLIDLNTPIRVGVDVASDTFARSSSSGWGTPSTPTASSVVWSNSGTATDWTVTGSVGRLNIAATQARIAFLTNGNANNVGGAFTASSSVVATGDAMIVGALARYLDGNNYYLLQMRFAPAGVVQVAISRNLGGAFVNVTSAVAVPGTYAANDRWRFEWQVVGNSISVKAYPEAGPVPAGWQLGYSDAQLVPYAGNAIMYWRQNSMTNVGTVTIDTDNYTLEAVEFPGYVTEWPTRWDQSGNDSWAPIKCSGILRRLQQGASPVKSPLYRQLSAQSYRSYWALEDDAGAISGANTAPGGRPMYVTDVTFGNSDPLLPAAKSVATFATATAKMYGYPANLIQSGTGDAVMFLFKFPGTVGTTTDCAVIGGTGRVTRWTLNLDSTAIGILGQDVDGAIVVTTGSSWTGVDPTKWVAMQLETETIGATTSWALIWHQVADFNAPFFALSGSYASSVPSLIAGVTFKSSAALVGMSWSHVWTGQNTLPFVTNEFAAVSSGFVGELASDRIVRNLLEEAIQGYVEPGASEPLGVQPIAAALPLIRDAEAADYGTLFESGWGLAFRPRSKRYSRTVDIALDRLSGHLADPPEPTYDDQPISNDWTVGRTNGAQGVNYADETHVAKVGRYDQSAQVNVATDDVLYAQAGWRVYLGTRRQLRWPSISIDLARNTALITQWRARPAWGGRMAVSNEMSQVMGLPPDVIMEGTSQTLSPYGWDVDVNGSPAKPWDVATLDDAALRLDTAGCVIDPTAHPTGITTGTTAITVNSDTTVPYWRPWAPTSTMPGEVPFNVTINGEVMTVTSVGNVTSVSKQVLTVTRAVNGVSKSHAASSSVSLTTPTYIAL